MTVRPLTAVALAMALCGAAAPAAVLAAPAHIEAAVADAGRPDSDKARDDARKPAAILEFAKVTAGQTVGELLPGGGYFTRIIAKAVGPTGKVYAYIPAAASEARVAPITAIAATDANVEVTRDPALAAPGTLDLVWTSQNYHDLHNNGSNAGAVNAAAFTALKKGGLYVVVDHTAKSGTGVSETATLHRIDPAAVKAEVLSAGFKFDGESKALRRASDPLTAKVFDLHDQTDQFAYRFRKP